jgi:two-component system LytT family sensor kinase
LEKSFLEFTIRNNNGKTDSVDLEKRKGIGIENTRQRLELLYPGKHSLKILNEDDTFTVILKLELIS